MRGAGLVGAAQAQLADLPARAVAADDADPAVPSRQQVPHGASRRRLVVDGDAREVGKAEALGARRHEDARRLHLVEGRAEALELAAEEDHPLGVARVLVVDGGADLVDLAREVGDDDLLLLAGERGLEGPEDVVEHAVADAITKTATGV